MSLNLEKLYALAIYILCDREPSKELLIKLPEELIDNGMYYNIEYNVLCEEDGYYLYFKRINNENNKELN